MPYERRWLVVIAIGLSMFLSALDATIVALALPPIAQHFQLSDSLGEQSQAYARHRRPQREAHRRC